MKKTKLNLEIELMRKKSEARIAATSMPATSSQAIALNPTDNEDIGEIPQEVWKCTLFAGLPQEEIAKIFLNKFKPINLY